MSKKSSGFAISTSDEYLIEENAKENSIKIDDKFWEKISEDIQVIEKNAIEWLEKHFGELRTEGHSLDGALIGTIWFKDDEAYEKALEIMEDESLRTGSGTLYDDNIIYKDVSEYGCRLIDVEINFFD